MNNFVQPVRQTNSLGVAGFIVSLIGVVATCGLLAPVGLLLSTLALFKKPRGFAFAGVVLGLIGSLMISVVVITGIGTAALVNAGFKNQADLEQSSQAQLALAGLAQRVATYRESTGREPSALSMLPNIDPAMLIDPWNRDYAYEPDATGFTLRSAGADGIAMNDDDVYKAWNYSADSSSSVILPRDLPERYPIAPLQDAAPMVEEAAPEAMPEGIEEVSNSPAF